MRQEIIWDEFTNRVSLMTRDAEGLIVNVELLNSEQAAEAHARLRGF